MYILKGEARSLIKTERSFKDQSWTEYKLKVEFKDGRDECLTLTKSLITDDNILYLESLKGRQIECNFDLSLKVGKNNVIYKTLYMNDLPVEI